MHPSSQHGNQVGKKSHERKTRRGWRPDPIFSCSLEEDASQSPRWIIEELLEEGEQLLLYGNPKVGKSQLGLQLAICVALDLPFLRWKVSAQKKVVYVNLEMGARAFAVRVLEVARELLAESEPAAPAREIPVTEIEAKLSARFRYVSSERSLDVLARADWMRWRRALLAEKPDLVVIDTLSKAHAADENISKEMTAVMKGLRELFDAPGPEAKPADPDAAVVDSPVETLPTRKMAHVLIHHAGKSREGRLGGARIRGSSAIHGEADVIFYVMSEGEVRALRREGPQRLEVEARNFRGDDVAVGRAENAHTFHVAEPMPPVLGGSSRAAISEAAAPDSVQHATSPAARAPTKAPFPSAKLPSPKSARNREPGVAEQRVLQLLSQHAGVRLLVADVVEDLGDGRKTTKTGIESAIRRMVKSSKLEMSAAKPQRRNQLPLFNPKKRQTTRHYKAINIPRRNP